MKLIHGVGINDADYNVYKTERVDGKLKVLWICPFYEKWKSMVDRCYSKVVHSRQPTYASCSVVPEWHYFMTFRAWMDGQDWEGKHLDKDILFPGNKIYGPDTCVFVHSSVNLFTSERKSARGQYPIGVYFHKASGKYLAQCCNIETDKRQYLGLFESPELAHQAWLIYKIEQAHILASMQTDKRIADALIYRYENYTPL